MSASLELEAQGAESGDPEAGDPEGVGRPRVLRMEHQRLENRLTQMLLHVARRTPRDW